MPTLTIGTPVIINYFYRPEARTVAVVTKVTTDFVEARYLYAGRTDPTCWAPPDEVTPTENYGVWVVPADTDFTVDAGLKVSIVRYKGGALREWQDPEPDTWWPADAQALALLKEWLGV